jgi:hypothetical protein
MKRSIIKTAILCMIAGLCLIGYSKTAFCTVPVETPKITMTTAAGKVNIILGGSGTATVDWGDGKSETLTLKEKVQNNIGHTYAASSDSRTIVISGNDIKLFVCHTNQLTALDVSKNKALMVLECSYNQLSVLDASKNTALKEFYCNGNKLGILDVSKNTALTRLACGYNQLSTLDVSKNTALTDIDCSENKLNATALNTLFRSLHSNDALGNGINITGNPGQNNCKTSIAEDKGWEFYY